MIPSHIQERHQERYRRIMYREIALSEALEETDRDWREFLRDGYSTPFNDTEKAT